jgi:hypothetical protein
MLFLVLSRFVIQLDIEVLESRIFDNLLGAIDKKRMLLLANYSCSCTLSSGNVLREHFNFSEFVELNSGKRVNYLSRHFGNLYEAVYHKLVFFLILLLGLFL